MMAEKLMVGNIPSSYINLGYDAEPSPGPSAPVLKEEIESSKDDAEPSPGPSAPVLKEDIESSKGYIEPVPGPSAVLKEEIESNNEVPSAPILELSQEPRRMTYSLPTLAFEDIYEACMEYVQDHCCYSSRFVKTMRLIEINNNCAFHYTLESFGEKRESGHSETPYRGQYIDGPQNGPPPNPWDISVPTPTLFKDAKIDKEIPHTAYVITCPKCSGAGKVKCSSCSGRGRKMCVMCGGSGHRGTGSERRSCTSCMGSGRTRCLRCSGSGRVKCSKCDGTGKIKCCKMLLVTWTNHSDNFLCNISNVPEQKIRKATGQTIFFEMEEKLRPIMNAPDVAVNVASTRLIRSHEMAFPNEKILKQRQILRAVHFTTVKYQWKETEGEFYVYGNEKNVYFEDYPQQCCCCTCC